MLSEFYIATEDFEQELKACARELANWRDVHHIQRHRMFDLGQDMLSFKESLVRVHISATMWMLDDVHEVSRHRAAPVPKWEDLWAYISGDHQLEQNAKIVVEAHLEDGRRQVERMVRRQGV